MVWKKTDLPDKRTKNYFSDAVERLHFRRILRSADPFLPLPSLRGLVASRPATNLPIYLVKSNADSTLSDRRMKAVES